MRARRTTSATALTAVLAVGGLVAGCSAATSPQPSVPTPSVTTGVTTGATTRASSSAPRSSSPSVTATTAPSFDGAAAFTLVERIAAIGPRDAVSAGFRTAAALVAGELRARGYTVALQQVPIPAGVSWGVRVPSGTSTNVIAEPEGFDPEKPHVVIGAHLDTVPQAPGAEDNASGVAVLLELASMLRQQPGALPVRFVVFGGEESRGSGWRWYAFGSRRYVDALSGPQRGAVRAMVSLDRVGRATRAVPVCHGGRGSAAVAESIRAAARTPTRVCVNRASDHVSFERAGIPSARIGSVPYGAYHSSADRPRVVDSDQLRRSGDVVWTWLRTL